MRTIIFISVWLVGLIPGVAGAMCRVDAAKLDRTIVKTLRAVKTNDTQAFLSLLRKNDVTYLGDKAISIDVMSNDLQARKGVYCEIFTCGGVKSAYQMALVAPTVKKRLGNLDAFALADVTLSQNGQKTALINYVENREACEWQLTAISLP